MGFKAFRAGVRYFLGMLLSPGGRRTVRGYLVNQIEEHPFVFCFVVGALLLLELPTLAATFSLGVPIISIFGVEGSSIVFALFDAIGVFIPVFKRLWFDVFLFVLAIAGGSLLTLKYIKSCFL